MAHDLEANRVPQETLPRISEFSIFYLKTKGAMVLIWPHNYHKTWTLLHLQTKSHRSTQINMNKIICMFQTAVCLKAIFPTMIKQTPLQWQMLQNITSIWPKILSNQSWSRIVHFCLEKEKNYSTGKQETYLKRHASVQLLFPKYGAEQHNSTGSCSTCTALPDLHFHKQNSLWAHFIISCRLLKTLSLKLRSFSSTLQHSNRHRVFTRPFPYCNEVEYSGNL